MKLPSHVGAAAIEIEHAPNGVTIVSVPALSGLGYGSSAPIHARCLCGATVAPTVSVALTALYQRIATDGVPLYGSIAVCGRCLCQGL